MSRSGYSEDCENLQLWRGAVRRAIRGKRGQAFLRELAAAMDEMPRKELIADELVREDGACCAIGVVFMSRSLATDQIDYEDAESVGAAVGIARAMAAEIAYKNDECGAADEGPAQRWQRMRNWIFLKLNQQA